MARASLKDPTHLYQTLRTADHAVRPGFGIHEMELGPDQIVPWHLHSTISDTFYVLSGSLRLRLREPDETLILAPTDSHKVDADRPHQVENAGDGPVTFLILQGVGDYDYVPLDQDSAAT